MQFIVSGQRIAVENFVTGKLYTILWKNDTQVTLTCISIGADCVVFQGEAPLNLFTLTMQNADTIDTIEPTQLGTTNYNNLINKPSINGVDLIGNKTSAALGIRDVPAIIESDDGKILTANSDGTYTWQPAPSSGTMDYTQLNNKPQINSVTLTGNVSLADLGAAAAADIPTTPADIGAEPAITSENMLDADLVDDTSSTHKFATSAQLAQIATNENNILSIQAQVNNVTYLNYGINLFDKTVYTDGMYLGTNAVETANADYFISDYIYLHDSSINKLTWYTNNGAAVRFVAFYDSNKNYINNSWKQIGGSSQVNTIDIPSNAVYVRISTQKNQLNTTQLEYGTDYSGYAPYIAPYYKLKIGNSIIVDKSGLGDYTTVTEAVANAKSGDVIYIYKGVYENEVIEAWGKNISLVGFDARNTIIRNSTDNYNTPPLEISVGSVSNLTFETIANAEPNVKSYAVHVEHDSLTNGNLTFTNCIFKAASNAAVGVGLRPNCIVEFNNCTFEVGNNLNALFFHDSANYSGIQTLICNCCKITAGNAQAIRIDDNNVSGTTMYIEFVNTLVRNMSNLSSNAVWFNNTGHESGSGIGGLTNTYLSDKSYGNSSAILNV